MLYEVITIYPVYKTVGIADDMVAEEAALDSTTSVDSSNGIA